MILANISNLSQVEKAHPLFKQAFAYLKTLDVNKVGDISGQRIDGEKLFLNANRTICEPKPENDKVIMETHRKYIDIQYIMKGKNRMGWTPAHLLEGKGQGYQELQEDLSGDLEFYESKPQTWFETLVGSVIIFYPEDAHAPLNGEGEVVKIVLKVQL